jgi:hypothetical protein
MASQRLLHVCVVSRHFTLYGAHPITYFIILPHFIKHMYADRGVDLTDKGHFKTALF